MAYKKKGGNSESWLGVEGGPSTPATTGSYHHIHTPHGHSSEYSGSSHGFGKHRQDSYPSGSKYGGSAGAGKKRKGSHGRGMKAV